MSVSLPWKWAEGAQDQCVSKESNILLTALYVLIDDHVVPPRGSHGREPLLSDSELITLAVAQVMLGYHRERRWIRHLHSSPEWRAMLVKASCAMRNRCVSVSSGRRASNEERYST